MDSSKLLVSLFIILPVLFATSSIQAVPENSMLFREYIGADSNNVTFSNVPIHAKVDFHFILSFAIDYTTSSHPSPTNGNFNVFWDSKTLTPSRVSSIKADHSNVKVAVSLGGDTVSGKSANFTPKKSSSSEVVPKQTTIEHLNRKGHICIEHLMPLHCRAPNGVCWGLQEQPHYLESKVEQKIEVPALTLTIKPDANR